MSLTGWLGLGAALALGLMYAAWSVQVSNLRAEHARDIAAVEKIASAIKGEYDAYKLEVEQTIGNNARTARQELQSQLDRNEQLAAENDRLRQQYATAMRERDDASRERTRILNNAPRTTDSLIDVRSRDFYRSVRERQLAARAAGPAPP